MKSILPHRQGTTQYYWAGWWELWDRCRCYAFYKAMLTWTVIRRSYSSVKCWYNYSCSHHSGNCTMHSIIGATFWWWARSLSQQESYYSLPLVLLRHFCNCPLKWRNLNNYGAKTRIFLTLPNLKWFLCSSWFIDKKCEEIRLSDDDTFDQFCCIFIFLRRCDTSSYLVNAQASSLSLASWRPCPNPIFGGDSDCSNNMMMD